MPSETTRRPSAVSVVSACFRLFPCVSALPMIRFATTASLRQPPAAERSPIALRNAKQCFQQHPTLRTMPLTTATPPNCTSGDTRAAKLCIRRHPREHTVHPATARASNPPLVVVGGTVCPTSCRQRHSLLGRLSSAAQFARPAVVGGTVCSAGCRQRHR